MPNFSNSPITIKNHPPPGEGYKFLKTYTPLKTMDFTETGWHPPPVYASGS